MLSVLTLVMNYIILILFVSISFSKPKYPADSLVKSTEITILKKIGLLPISLWQRISYNFNYFDCQFYPSCSNYCANAITQYGLLKGMVIGSERITRCNPFAFYYHMELNHPFYDKDGRLIDPIHQNQKLRTRMGFDLTPFIYFIPGIGRAYAGRKLDGLMGLWTVYLTTSSAIYASKYKNHILGPMFLGIAGITYLGEVYGAWRADQYYQKIKSEDI